MATSILFHLLVCFTICSTRADETDIQCKQTTYLPKVDLSKHCSKEMGVDYAIVVKPHTSTFRILQSCLNCSLILRTKEYHQLTATFYSLNTETSADGGCTENRLDVYDGDKIESERLLSNVSGICGCNLPSERAYKSSNNTMLLHFFTKCNTTTHGEFDLVVASVVNENYNKTECAGKFECLNEKCIDKNLLCNGEQDCSDGSDEKDCRTKNATCVGQFECLDGKCLNKNLICNGKNDCPDRSDEANCTTHGGQCVGQFECKNGKCIDKNLVCNGAKNCPDGSDERECKTRHSLLMYVLIGIACLVFVMVLVIMILLCYKYCCTPWRLATRYRKMF